MTAKYQALYSYKLTFRFTTDAGILSYLNGKTFQVEDCGFCAGILSELTTPCKNLSQKLSNDFD